MSEFMTPTNFAAKVDWEGGIHGALGYGLKHTHLDPDDPASAELRAAWAELETLFRPFEVQCDIVGPLLDALEGIEPPAEKVAVPSG